MGWGWVWAIPGFCYGYGWLWRGPYQASVVNMAGCGQYEPSSTGRTGYGVDLIGALL